MAIKTYFIKYQYLYRFILTLAIALLIPAIIFANLIVLRSYNEMLRKNEDYYRDITGAFVLFFQNHISELKSRAISISIDSKKDNPELLKSTIELDPYYYNECAKTLTKYRLQDPHFLNIGLYYYGTDYLITNRTKYNLSGFCNTYVNTSNPQIVENINQFFTPDSSSRIKFCSVFNDSLDNKMLFLGIPVKMGNQSDSALIFYTLDPGSIDTSLFATQSATSLEFYIFDSSNELFYSTTSNTGIVLNDEEFLSFFNDSSKKIHHYIHKGRKYTAFKLHGNMYGLTYISFVPFDHIEENIYIFYTTMKKISAGILILLFLLLAFVVYVNYKPIKDLLRGLNRQRAAGELATISNALTEMRNEASEQNMLIMDFLISNLLYNIPIPKYELRRLNVEKHSGSYCVLVVSNLKLNTAKREKLTSDISLNYNTIAFITDMLYDEHTIIICLLGNVDITDLATYIEKQIFDSTNVNSKIYIGSVVNRLNDIHKSYMKSLQEVNFDENAISLSHFDFQSKLYAYSEYKEQGCKTLIQKIIDFIQENYTDPSLSQRKVADHFNISIYSLSRLFNENLGIGFTEYINGKRIGLAKRLLLTSDESVAEIGKEVGIINANYFSRLFKTNCGITPSKFRTSQLIPPDRSL